MKELKRAEQVGDDAAVVHCHEELNRTGGYSKPALATTIMSGLGFSAAGQQALVNSFSGGLAHAFESCPLFDEAR